MDCLLRSVVPLSLAGQLPSSMHRPSVWKPCITLRSRYFSACIWLSLICTRCDSEKCDRATAVADNLLETKLKQLRHLEVLGSVAPAYSILLKWTPVDTGTFAIQIAIAFVLAVAHAHVLHVQVQIFL